ncbi:hypothetical protein C8J57DRAFT_1222112 [Mycena rebaudengoi]|nr:hypothetical protein C8J57DRAFT_1222112 [Mycena rebaudengoi]
MASIRLGGSRLAGGRYVDSAKKKDEETRHTEGAALPAGVRRWTRRPSRSAPLLHDRGRPPRHESKGDAGGYASWSRMQVESHGAQQRIRAASPMENDQGRTRMHEQRVGRGATSILRENGDELARGTLCDRDPTPETHVEHRKRIREDVGVKRSRWKGEYKDREETHPTQAAPAAPSGSPQRHPLTPSLRLSSGCASICAHARGAATAAACSGAARESKSELVRDRGVGQLFAFVVVLLSVVLSRNRSVDGDFVSEAGRGKASGTGPGLDIVDIVGVFVRRRKLKPQMNEHDVVVSLNGWETELEKGDA